jgi:ribose transport system ATP-binding protein
MSVSAPNAVLSVSGIGKTYAQPVLAASTDADARRSAGADRRERCGQSTLSKIIGGLVTPTTGQMQFRARLPPGSRTQAEALGVRMVMQELNLPTLSVAENLFLDNLPSRFGWISRKQLRKAAIEAMAQVGLDAIDPDTLVGELGIGHQQMVEIARNLIGDCHVLILDEPTAMLTAREVEMLFSRSPACRRVAWRSSISPTAWKSWRAWPTHRRAARRQAGLRRADGQLQQRAVGHLMVGRELGEHIDLGRARSARRCSRSKG